MAFHANMWAVILFFIVDVLVVVGIAFCMQNFVFVGRL